MRERRPYKVEVIKTIVGTIEVYARTPEEAEVIADSEVSMDTELDISDEHIEVNDSYPADEEQDVA